MIAFFIRKYNDIDHITPIIYKIAESGHEEIRLFCLNYSYPLGADYRLTLLRRKFGIEATYLYQSYTPRLRHKIIASLLCGPRERQKDEGKVHFLVRRLYAKFINPGFFDSVVKKYIFSANWAQSFCLHFKPSVMVFDWVKPYQYVTGHLLTAAKTQKIPTVAVPHGIPMFTNELFSLSLVKAGKPLDYGKRYGNFDHFIVQFRQLKQAATRTGLSSEKVHVLGSTRFCEEWRVLHTGLVSHIDENYDLGGEECLKVVFMDTLSMYRINTEAVLESLQRLSQLDGLQLLIKPHTRSNKLSSLRLGAAGKVVDKVPSGVLCEWADVLIGTSSSILLEAFRLNKVLLYPKFFHQNTMLFEEFGACWHVEDHDALEAALFKLMSDPAYRPYPNDAVNAFLTEVVCGGLESRDVLKEYSDFILGPGSNSDSRMTTRLLTKQRNIDEITTL